MRKYIVTNIEYDTDGRKVVLPKELTIEVPDDVQDDEIEEYIGDEISNQTGYCHCGFSLTEIK
jgi:hypothetical protein